MVDCMSLLLALDKKVLYYVVAKEDGLVRIQVQTAVATC